MGSRIMHAIIANRIVDILSIDDRTSFLLGSLAPDAVSTKDISHFYIGNLSDYTRGIDFSGFIKKYSEHSNRDYLLGYYTHLIADDIWLTGFYKPWLKNRIEADHSILPSYHQDFKLLNGKLLNYYGSTDQLRNTLNQDGEMIDLDEVKGRDVVAFLPYILGDMEYDVEVIGQGLRIFTLNQIIGYIETSVERGVFCIQQLRSGNDEF
ncbi:hydrolase [Anaerobacillus alkaliphilus]|uniref:Hydrolase n=1 Tax=Anaerobacillus alkaliphilus TaxID=1548597 RepID=A0A4Q0VYQ7_9BACI|nr:zinc dependent phospholipase C family protein [Anaerobacillus alkaliphilus]RXJ04306.1 hydrolase [Anaerobacillus alkaliphilus]